MAAAEPAGADDEVVIDAPQYFRIFKSGRIERVVRPVLPAGPDEATGIASKDVVLDASTGLSVRVYLPTTLHDDDPSSKTKKLPVLVYFHGGAFLLGSAASATCHSYVNRLAAAAGAIVVSVEYRLAPEHPLPTAYEDCWAALRWATSARDEWIASRGDVARRLFLAGVSAGGNIVHDVLVRAASAGGPSVEGAVLLHPWFGGTKAIDDGEDEGYLKLGAKLWAYACGPGAVGGFDDPRMNPLVPGALAALEKFRCARMLVCAAKEDKLFPRNRAYYDAVAACAWSGTVEWLQSEGEDHGFFLKRPECENAKHLMNRVVTFIVGA